MNVTREDIDNVVLLTIADKDANLTRSEKFKEIVFKEIESGSRNLIISFENVEYLDSSFLGALVAILKNLVPKNGKLSLIALNSDIRNLFELTRLDKIFDLKESLNSALESFR
ncbi:MAG: anti-sigma factor antagonist [Pedobacter sp.]|jgi:anti-sigma B factor antagonist|nr:MAG: anti-sigma factor antagonist [Pedobacter sp.]